jgi:hypothetical protein
MLKVSAPCLLQDHKLNALCSLYCRLALCKVLVSTEIDMR